MKPRTAMQRKIGIFGGTFDPFHKAHKATALRAADVLELEKVLVIPAKISPFKKSALPGATDAQRFHMVALSCEDEPRLVPCDIELKRSGVSYAYDTVKQLSGEMPGCDFYFVMGSDAFAGLNNWYKSSELFKLCSFVVMDRPGAPTPPYPPGASILHIDIPPMEISASAIRDRISKGLDSNGMLEKKIECFIKENMIYCNKNK